MISTILILGNKEIKLFFTVELIKSLKNSIYFIKNAIFYKIES